MSTGKVLLGALAGIAIGAVAGILLAPEKGSATRRQIIDKSNGYVDKLKSKYNGLRDSLRRDAEGLANNGKEKYDEMKKDVKNAF